MTRYNVFYCGFFMFQAKHWNQVKRYLRKVGIDFACVQKVEKRQDIERKWIKRLRDRKCV